MFVGDLPASTQQKLVPVDEKKGYGLKTFGNVNIFSDGVYQVVIFNTRKGYAFHPSSSHRCSFQSCLGFWMFLRMF